jgi:hypothetical protein
MNDARPPNPLPHPEGPRGASIDDRILAVEQRLLAREQTLAAQFNDLGRQLRSMARPRNPMPPLLGLGAAVGVLWWLLRHRSPARAAFAGLPWTPWVALAWPVLPAAWRARLLPAPAATVLSLASSLARRWLARTPRPPLAT